MAYPKLQPQIDLTAAKFVNPTVIQVEEVDPEVDVLDAKNVIPPIVPTVGMSALQREGLSLARYVLVLMGLVTIIILGCAAFSEFSGPSADSLAIKQIAQQIVESSSGSASAPEATKVASELMSRLNESRRSSRDFWIAIGQFLLLNLFLPVLTSILGYIFGTSKN